MVKNMQGLSRKSSTQSFHHSMNSPPPSFDMTPLLKERLEAEFNKAAYADSYRAQLELVHEHNKQCLRLEQMKLDNMLQSATLHAQSPSYQQACETPAPILATSQNAESYAKPFCDFLTDNPTVFHAVDSMAQGLKHYGFTKLSERDSWRVEPGGKYFVERNGSSLIAFVVGDDYKAGNGAAVLAGHVDALTAKLKPVSKLPTKAGYVELGVAPYAGGLGPTWWDRDLSIGGRVLVRKETRLLQSWSSLAGPLQRFPPSLLISAPLPTVPSTLRHRLYPSLVLNRQQRTRSSLKQRLALLLQPNLLASFAPLQRSWASVMAPTSSTGSLSCMISNPPLLLVLTRSLSPLVVSMTSCAVGPHLRL